MLEPDQFREFSANIKKLNAGHQSVDETLLKVASHPSCLASLVPRIPRASHPAPSSLPCNSPFHLHAASLGRCWLTGVGEGTHTQQYPDN